jgi:ThiF family
MSRAKDRARFYEERDHRTIGYGIPAYHLERPVGIAVGEDAASSPTGQIFVLAALNMMCRIHRRIHMAIPDSDLQVTNLTGGRTLREAAEGLALAIDPYIQLGISPDGSVPTLGIGRVAAALHAGVDGYAAEVREDVCPISDHPASTIGAGLAACLGTASLFQSAIESRPVLRRVSLWRFEEGTVAEVGPRLTLGPVDVGDRVVLVGAGAVGSAILYWLRLLGVSGHWVVIDGDLVELHNTNRSLGFLATHAGWPDGLPGGEAAHKADVGAALIDAEPVTKWYHEWVSGMGLRPDLMIPVANNYGVRSAISQLGLPLTIHGTTSPRWSAELHRHGPCDGCLSCRFPPKAFPDLSCAEGPALPRDIQSPGDDGSGSTTSARGDTALPFLSAAAGLLVVAALTQLGMGYLNDAINLQRLLFESGIQRSWQGTPKRCRPNCRGRPSPRARRVLNVGTRWSVLDDQ